MPPMGRERGERAGRAPDTTLLRAGVTVRTPKQTVTHRGGTLKIWVWCGAPCVSAAREGWGSPLSGLPFASTPLFPNLAELTRL